MFIFTHTYIYILSANMFQNELEFSQYYLKKKRNNSVDTRVGQRSTPKKKQRFTSNNT